MTRRDLAVSLVLLLLPGCVVEEQEGKETRVHYAWWVPAAVACGGITAAGLGVLVRRWSSRPGWGLIVGGPIAALVFGPPLYTERVTIDDRGAEWPTGFFGMFAGEYVRFEKITGIRIIAEDKLGRRGVSTTEGLLFERKNGLPVRLAATNGVRRRAAELILDIAEDRGIPVLDER